jgi:polysaccharide deacetylase family protein (PEP-CTERM system associated)
MVAAGGWAGGVSKPILERAPGLEWPEPRPVPVLAVANGEALLPVVNAFSVDVEDYYQVEAFRELVSRDRWNSFESRVCTSTRTLLRLLERRAITGTFFVLGCVAERFPRLVRECAAAGHEIASHGWDHRPVTELGREEFRRDVRRTKHLLEDLAGSEVLGYRAPTYSIVRHTLWALQVLLEEGYRYDSSIFPIVHDRYGIPDAPRFPWTAAHGPNSVLLEFPISTVRIGRVNLPFVGGGYLRHLPERFVHWGMRRVSGGEKRPVMVYVHPWEVDPGQPRLAAPLRTRFRHYHNLEKMEQRLDRLFGAFRFGPVREVLGL